MTVTNRDAPQNYVAMFANESSVKIFDLMKQARYDVMVTVCSDTCCHETKPVTLSKGTSCM